MAAPVSLTTGYANTIMSRYLPAFWAGVKEDVPFLRRLMASDNGVKSDPKCYYVQETVINAIPYSMRVLSTEGTTIPAALDVTDVMAKWSLTEHALKKTFSTRALNEGNLWGSLDIESANMQAAQHEIAHYTKHLLMGDSYGILTRVTEVPTSLTFKVDNPYALRVGMVIDGWTTAAGTGATADGITITGFDKDTEVFTSATHSLAVGNYIAYQDVSPNYWGQNLQSLLANTDARMKGDVVITPAVAAYANLTRASTANWASFALETNGAYSAKAWARFTSKLVQAQNVSTSGINAAYAAPEAIAALLEAIPEEERLLGDPVGYGTTRPVALKSQFLTKGTLDLVPVNGFWPYCIAFLNENDIGVRWPKEPGWDTSGGTILTSNVKEVSGQAGYTAVWLQTLGLIGRPIEHALQYGFDYLAG